MNYAVHARIWIGCELNELEMTMPEADKFLTTLSSPVTIPTMKANSRRSVNNFDETRMHTLGAFSAKGRS